MIARLPRTAQRVLQRTSRSSTRGGMSDYEQELNPIFDEEMEEELQTRRRIQPLQKIFDILGVGNYVSANVADELSNAVLYSQGRGGDAWKPGDILNAIVEGISGKRKGTYEKVLRDTWGVGEEKIFKNAPEGSKRGQWDYADFFGLIGDVVLDPLTYATFGGASKGARIAADSFADDAVRLLGKQLLDNPEQLAKLTRSKWSSEVLQTAIGSDNTAKAFRQIMKQNDDLGRLFSMTYTEAQKKALRRTAAQLPELGGELVERGAGKAPDIAEMAQKATSGAYQHAGERFKLRVLGQEIGVGEATAFADARRKGWEQFGDLMKQQPGVANARNAIWSVMNRGKIGELKRAFGIKNPYQKYLRNMEREQGGIAAEHASIKMLNEVSAPIADMNPAEMDQVLDFMASQEDMATAVFRGTKAVPSGRVYDDKIIEAGNKIKEILEPWQQRLSEQAQAIGESELKTYEWYLPEVFRLRGVGSGSGNQRMVREFTFNEQRAKESRILQTIFGVDENVANMAVENNVSGFSTNLQELLAAKAVHQAKMESRYSMIDTFKGLGLNLDDMATTQKGAQVANDLRMGGRDITQLGLRPVDHPAFQTLIDGRKVNNYLFDYDVADVIERTLDFTGPKRTQIGKMFRSYMSWWKGMALLNTGYTMRNFYSNTMTQALRHGPRAFNPREVSQSLAGVLHIVKQNNPKNIGKALDAVGKTESWLNSTLNTMVGPRLNVRQLAEEAHRRGAISEQLFAFDGQDIAERIAGKGKQPVRTVARKVNTVVENVPRFQSFLIDYADNVGEEAAEDAVLTWSARQARQWFIDYGDLTDFEQRYMKNIIPFYTWMRKNIANQVNGVALYPELYALVPKVERAVQFDDPDYDPALVPEWMRNEAMFPISEPEPGRYRMFRPDFAYQDLNLLPLLWEEGKFLPNFSFDELKKEVINSTAPWVRHIASKMTTETGYNYFYREDLGETGDAPYLMRLLVSRPGTIAMLDGVMRLLGNENGAELEVDENGKLRMDAQLAQTLEDYLPVLRQVEMLFTLPTAAVPGFEEAIEGTLNAYDDYDRTSPADRAERWMQLMSYFLGIKTKDVDLEKEKERLGYDIYYRSRDLLNEQRGDQPGTQLRRDQSRARTLSSIRRLGG